MSDTPEVEKDNSEAFLKEYGELVKKYEMDFVTFPMYEPNGNGKWELTVKTQLVTTKGQPVKSPFVAS